MGSIPIKVRSKKHSFIIKIIYLYLYTSIKLQTKEQRAFCSPPKSTKTDLLQLVTDRVLGVQRKRLTG